ncbi:MAG: SMI1/KNR4 family protein [Planctomycetota bacterium]|jgi:cell wall assembly regulator SMI1
MGTIKFKNAGPSVEAAKAAALEELLGTTLPEDYRACLLEHNGGRPVPRSFRVPGHREQVFDVHYLYGLADRVETSLLEWRVNNYTDFVQDGLLPIGGTETGDQILLRVAGDPIGEVLFWDYTSGEGDQALYPIAPNFAEFLDSLFEGESVS